MRNFNGEILGLTSSASFSNAIGLGGSLVASIHIIATGDLSGVISIQASCDLRDPQNWVDVEDSSATVTAPSVHFWNIDNVGWSFVRVKFSPTSGEGSLIGRVNIKSEL